MVEEDQFKVWQAQETALQNFYADFKLKDAVAIREAAGKFIEWLEEGEDTTETFLRVLPRSLPLAPRVRRFREGVDPTSNR